MYIFKLLTVRSSVSFWSPTKLNEVPNTVRIIPGLWDCPFSLKDNETLIIPLSGMSQKVLYKFSLTLG